MRQSINPEKFSDFSFAFTPIQSGPNEGDIPRLINENAIKRSLKNLILTNRGERLFYPSLGSGVVQMLFEQISPPTAFAIEENIKYVIQNNEPRVKVIDVIANPDYDNSGYNVYIKYEIINVVGTVTVNFFLELVK